jgi:hypothetical protein
MDPTARPSKVLGCMPVLVLGGLITSTEYPYAQYHRDRRRDYQHKGQRDADHDGLTCTHTAKCTLFCARHNSIGPSPKGVFMLRAAITRDTVEGCLPMPAAIRVSD